MKLFRPIFLFLFAVPGLLAQETPVNQPTLDPTKTSPFNRTDARTISLAIPAPRGMITDRFGQPLAQNEVSYQLVIRFKQLNNATPGSVAEYASSRLAAANEILAKPWEPTEKELWEHYRHRRWLPFVNRQVFSREEMQAAEPKLVSDLEFLEIYTRHYPEKDLAAHILGFTRSTGPLQSGPVNPDDPLWEFTAGARGLEKIFDKHLTGKPGRKRLLFDQDGTKLMEELSTTPKPGGTVVTTLDIDWQRKAREILDAKTKGGAFVVIDIVTGEVMVLASNPSFDPNEFGLRFDGNRYMELLEDESKPMIARSFQGVYPPASTFKPVVALAALDQGLIGPQTTINCPASVTLGNHTFKNWHSSPEGPLNAAKAIARSCNPWFYIVCQRFPSEQGFLSVAKALGMGSKTGLPLYGEKAGIMPTDAYMRRTQGRDLKMGDRLNMSIGQGPILVTPLQVAQAMAGIGDGFRLPKLHLVRQLQDRFGNVVDAASPETRNNLGVKPESVAPVQKGMYDVVNAGYGTGKRASLSYAVVCGKTGTAQWGPKSKKRRLAWFSGFFPLENPRFAFAALYEGAPGERVSGGRLAAPIVHDFFEAVKDDAERIISPPKAVVVVEDPPARPEPEAAEDSTTSPTPLEGDALDQAARRAVIVESPDGQAPGGNDQPRRAVIVEEPETELEPEEPRGTGPRPLVPNRPGPRPLDPDN